MYEFIFEQCILRYLNDACIFIWTVYFKVLKFYIKKISLQFYNFYIYFYNLSLFYIFYATLKMRFWYKCVFDIHLEDAVW